VIIYTQFTFCEGGHSKEQLRVIDDEWKKLDTEFNDVHSAYDSLKTKLDRFQKHCNKRIKVLYDDRDTSKQNQTHNVSEIENRMTDMEPKFSN